MAESSPIPRARAMSRVLLILAALTGFAAVAVRNAWLSDDAYITFRTVDNFVNGYGLTWNVAERVQTYTHPLWMLLLSGAYALTHEIFFTSLALSILISLATVAWVALAARAPLWGGLGVLILTLSKAFTDYSTSGLENPLSHLLLAAFLLVYLRRELNATSLFWLAFLAALGIVNRVDMLLLYLPVLVYGVIKVRTWRGVALAALGMAPLLLWEGFSLFYYGFPFPNTAYAKLNSGLITRDVLLRDGLSYLHNSLAADPLTLTATLTGMALPFITRAWRKTPAVAGIALYLAYIVTIGGDFMSGRFFSASLLTGVILLVHSDGNAGAPALDRPATWPWPYLAALTAGLLLVGFLARYSPLRAQGEAGPHSEAAGAETGWIAGRNITDERANYYHNTGLLRALVVDHPLPDHDWAAEGRAARLAGPAVVRKGSVGFFGYFAGPEVYVLDEVALGNALLARLPVADPNWKTGHYGRVVPRGYVESLESGTNRISDPHLATYYEALSLVIRGDLWDVRRWREIYKLNTGAYDADLQAYAYFEGATFNQTLRITNPTGRPFVCVYVWNNNAGEVWLLDDDSQRGQEYTIGWRITARGVELEGTALQSLMSIGALTDNETLNMGVIFSPDRELTQQDKYEYRFWFRMAEDGTLRISLPGKSWHSGDATQQFWLPEDANEVMEVIQ
ncbi:MAG: hypothetical protein JXA21_04435 [Anaerolineae bacterium]|nr:hypothetical protein [Anaerolineae bacterium]